MSDGVLVVDGGRAAAQPHRPATEVAVGILIDEQGRYLLTTRPTGKAYAGYWEFPGGKVESGETVEQALRRELQEEVGVTIGQAQIWRTQLVDYPHALVHLNFCKVYDWTGALQMHEGQQFVWTSLPVLCEPVLPGTVPVLTWLAEEAAGG
ncbi:MAG: (deoxy)nucleoside triphosphate pyrophosphohydrolase [Hydrogenophaga sp.]|uniref:(deoxy)nucleoside triphosphate pyrophosphohydrolase n=1 Tax=Hydrogenophaga sp. TaxID=1904254 RepID=UPI001DA2E7FE|nr:(deoxy)nucleoside triphosphate pyrophosphohydrolase [Hydrogenophaga sp.]MBX3611715.1 (deoxy)nucleoside triphosphate pyrophosphohydrolase [Hydrogenophaga sp.]